MSEKVYNVPAEWAARAFLNNEKYLAMYKRSIDDPNLFWGEMGKRIDWIKPYTKVKNTSYAPDNVSIKWYEDGTLRDWEQGAAEPDQAARSYLKVIARNPEAVLKALSDSPKPKP